MVVGFFIQVGGVVLHNKCGYLFFRMSLTGLLLTGGDGPSRADLDPFLSSIGPIVAADSGYDLALSLGIEPELIVGDMDSVRDCSLPEWKVRRFPRDKSLTDTELGLQVLKERGCDRVVIAGGGGGRLDHILHIVGLFERMTLSLCWVTAAEHVEVIRGTDVFAGSIGQTVSFIALSAGAEIECSQGLRWPLDGMRWTPGEGGVSNIITSTPFKVHVVSGAVLMVRMLSSTESPLPP